MITEIHRSPYTKLHPLALGNCRWTSGFWSDKFSVCQESMVPYMGKLLCGDIGHALNNFKIAAGLLQGEHQGMYWHDGDFYKWLEAVMYTAVYAQDEILIAQIDEYIDVIAQAQRSNGYLQTQVQLNPEIEPYTNRKYHEMYNTGHLFIAACLHFRATGKRKFLEVAIKQADLLYEIFFPENEKYGRFGFNQTQIMGLVELYRCTGTRHYLELAERFVNRRGTYPVEHDSSTEGYPIGDMVQERTPLRQESEAVGHAVLALYYYAGAADIYAETGEETLRQALVRLWQNITEKKMYLTGAVGQTHYGASTNRDKIEEGFIDDYMLPNLTAYNETCANICNAIFSRRMLQLEGESKYADIIELVLYNSALSGIDIEGERYFYANPLRMIHGARSYGDHENATETANRESYLECFCCPPNLVRTIAQVSGWAYSLTDHGIAVNLFGSNYLSTKLLSGSKLELTQTSEYPWQGRVDFVVEACPTSAMEILLRIPSWADDTHIFINNAEVEEEITAGKYFKITRRWEVGDTIRMDIPMEIQIIEGHPRVEEIRNQVAIKRGPIVYCIESPDLPENVSILDVYFSGQEDCAVEYRPDFLGGTAVLKTKCFVRREKNEGLYHAIKSPQWQAIDTILVPYYAWSNRGTAEMTVFMPLIWQL